MKIPTLLAIVLFLAQDWPQWRGPARDGGVASFTAPPAWPDTLTQKWKIDVGLGYANPVLVGNRLYVFTRQGENEVMLALDPATGNTIWKTEYPAPFTLNRAAARHEKGPKSTPTFANGKLYTLGMSGIVTAFDAATGKQVWQKPAPATQPLYHTAMSPLVDRGLVIVHVGGHNNGALTAFDANTGDVKWSWNGDGPGYGSPIVAELEGTRQVITFTQDNLVGLSAATGELLWKREYKTRSTQNTITPILYSGMLIIAGLEKPINAIRIARRDNQWVAEDVWENAEASFYLSNGVIVRDTLFGFSHRNSGQYVAIDAKTGKTLWLSEPRQGTNAAIVRAGELLFMLEDDGELVVARANVKAFEPVKRYTVATSATWAQPVIAGNRIFVRDVSSLALMALETRIPGQVEFRTHVIDAAFPGGYAVAAIDINKDGKLDIVANSLRVSELPWYENPAWQRRVIADGMSAIVNFAAEDLDGDGVPEVAIENAFAMVPARSEGLVWLLRHAGDPRQKWNSQRIDAFPTSHHIVWADVDGDRKKELVNAPLVGAKSLAPTYDQDKTPIFWYRQGDWQRHSITNDVNGIIHRVRPLAWDGNGRDQLLVASFDGITLYRATGSGANLRWESQQLSPGHSDDKAPRLGASDVAVGRLHGKRFLASVEPWHGNEIVIHTQDAAAKWIRKVLFSEMTTGHEVAVGDFNGDGHDDIVAGDQGARSAAVHVMYAPSTPGGEWTHQVLDNGGMAASGCVTADLNNDRRIDILCIGSATGNIKWYENAGPFPPAAR
ncbi:MAG: PQQ-binding-like beta-propeller repeat protein [Acidobacteria bacterium]|nr:PQQ-binding-like beta-propeller repeat protein [Acidobacteriota bacterium]